MQGQKKQDLTINFELKMSEAQFIVDALAGVKFKADKLIEKIVDRVNPQLADQPNGPDPELPIGISEEMDDRILELFSEYYNDKGDNIDFDFSKKGCVVAICKFGGDQAKKLIKTIETSEVFPELTINVNQEMKGITAFVFMLAHVDKSNGVDSAKMTIVPSFDEKPGAKKILSEPDSVADLKGTDRPKVIAISPEFDKEILDYFESITTDPIKSNLMYKKAKNLLTVITEDGFSKSKVNEIREALTEGSEVKMSFKHSKGVSTFEFKQQTV